MSHIKVSTFNVRTLKNVNQIYEIIASANVKNLDILVCKNTDLYMKMSAKGKHNKRLAVITWSRWRTSVNATTGGIGILNKHAYNNLINVNLVSNRILLANFNGNPQTSIIV